MQKIRIGLVGLGSRSYGWIQNIKRDPRYRITALCDLYEHKVQRAAGWLGDSKVAQYVSYEKMLDKEDLDAIGVCTAPLDQCKIICDSLEAGKHVICEVPLSYRLEDIWKIVVAVERSGMKFQMAEQVRFWGYMHEWKELVQDGSLGKVVYAEGQYWDDYGYWPYFWDPASGEYIGDPEEAKKRPQVFDPFRFPKHPIAYLPHELSPLLMVLDDRVTTVSCMGNRRSYAYPDIQRPDYEVAIMRTEKDTLLRLSVGFTVNVKLPTHWYQLVGTKGSVEWKRASWDKPKLFLKNGMMHDWQATDWTEQPRNTLDEARDSGHGGVDYYPFATFADSLLYDKKLEVDVYTAAEVSAPGVVAGISAEHEGQPYEVPRFRPDALRKSGEMPTSLEPKRVEATME